jgi:hypothetical protein
METSAKNIPTKVGPLLKARMMATNAIANNMRILLAGMRAIDGAHVDAPPPLPTIKSAVIEQVCRSLFSNALSRSIFHLPHG